MTHLFLCFCDVSYAYVVRTCRARIVICHWISEMVFCTDCLIWPWLWLLCFYFVLLRLTIFIALYILSITCCFFMCVCMYNVLCQSSHWLPYTINRIIIILGKVVSVQNRYSFWSPAKKFSYCKRSKRSQKSFRAIFQIPQARDSCRLWIHDPYKNPIYHQNRITFFLDWILSPSPKLLLSHSVDGGNRCCNASNAAYTYTTLRSVVSLSSVRYICAFPAWTVRRV